jgi:hypothetical protein
MSSLEKIGITVQRGSADGTTSLGFTLPEQSRVAASFTKEGAGQKLAKLFSRELQTGDEAFDHDVYIKTDTLELTKKLLEVVGVRDAIANIVRAGGVLQLDGPFVQVELAGDDADDSDVATIVQALLALGA